MKRIFKQIFILSLFLGSALPLQATEKYILDPQHTYVLWHVNHFGFSNPSGKWIATGTLDLDEKNIQNSHVEVTINIADMITGIPDLDKHLKGKLFFDTTQYPTATFVSHKVEAQDNTVQKVYGVLTIKGISKPVTLNVKLNKIGKNPITDKESIGFSGNTTLLRSDFGIKTLLPSVGDEVKINIEIEASRMKT